MSLDERAPRIAVGADHGGFALKRHLAKWLAGRGHEVVDCGSHDGAPCDYPLIAADVARRVASGACRLGIVVDGAGIGSAMAANKVAGVRAALCYDVSSARNSREHNDANVLTLGARLIGEGLAEQIVETFVTTACTEPRHKKRVAMIAELERDAAGGPCPAGAAPGPPEPAPACPVCLQDKPLAGHAAPPQNAPPAGVREFRARAARQLAMAADHDEDLSPAEIDRIADRIAEIIAAGGHLEGGMWCWSGVCIDLATARRFIELGAARIGTRASGGPLLREIARYIDHTLLRPDATAFQIETLCTEAAEHVFASVCVNPCWVKACAKRLRGTPVKVCTVIGFPLGANAPEVKALEARRAIRDGAGEIDMVINVGALKSGDDALVLADIRGVVDAGRDGGALVKVIIETALLTDEEKVRACVLARRARADFVKTSTGFASGGATAADVALMAEATRGARMGVKASGGVKSLGDLRAMVEAGATRIGASAGVRILKEAAGAA
jgi:deoxyribose-phosphate aldolase